MTPTPEIEPGRHWWEASAHTTAPFPLPPVMVVQCFALFKLVLQSLRDKLHEILHIVTPPSQWGFIANHTWSNNDHRIYFDNASIIDTGNYRIRKILES